MTQEALAKKVSLTRTSIINIEKGRQQILLHNLVEIARALQVSPAELIPHEDNIEVLLRDKPKKGRDWIMSSAIRSKEQES
jgi:transcriptional regulator with XRE-family HTH domain